MIREDNHCRKSDSSVVGKTRRADEVFDVTFLAVEFADAVDGRLLNFVRFGVDVERDYRERLSFA